MKVKDITKTAPEFKPYTKTVEITIESKQEELILAKVKSMAENGLMLSDDNGDSPEDCGFSSRECEIADDFVTKFFKSI